MEEDGHCMLVIPAGSQGDRLVVDRLLSMPIYGLYSTMHLHAELQLIVRGNMYHNYLLGESC